MGTILKRERRDGSIAYLAQIAITRQGQAVHRESKTFHRERMAKAWIDQREAQLKRPGSPLGREATSRAEATLAHAIDRYVSTSKKAIGKSKAQVLRTIKNGPLGDVKCSEITSRDLVEYAQTLGAAVQPQTVQNYLSHLSSVFSIAKPGWGIDLDRQEMADAQRVARSLGLTAKSNERDRRPTLDELDRLLKYFADRSARRPASSPMVEIVLFGMFSTRRQEEITRITWADYDEDDSAILVRNMKHPGQKIGNHVRCDLPPEAMRVIRAMPRVSDQIFPFSTDAISAAFTRACQFLEIADLRFHDLRHEGISRCFEMGWTIPRVAAVSGHRSWQSLQRYTHLRKAGDKYKDWAWLPAQDGPAA